jgi:peptidoglycan/xylan/chitin deacetylase (PgdA/CDA1 family)
MRVPGLGRIRRAARRVGNRWRAGAVVLLYHRVTRLGTDPQWLSVSPEEFDRQLEMLRREYRVMALGEVAKGAREGTLPAWAVAITFDDGYADNLLEAKPLLEMHGVPATVFVASGFVGAREEFFWDELDRLLLRPGRLPRQLNLAPPAEGGLGSPMSCELGADEPWVWTLSEEDAEYTVERARGHARWNVLSAETPTGRHAAYRAVCPALASAGPAERARWLAAIRGRLGVAAEGRESHRTMTQEELRLLATSYAVQIGAHTVSHARLSSLSAAEQAREVGESRRTLEEVLGRPVTTFSYPFGNHDDYTPATVAAVREAGFEVACSNFGGVVRRGADALQLNRMLARDWSADELDRRIREACVG